MLAGVINNVWEGWAKWQLGKMTVDQLQHIDLCSQSMDFHQLKIGPAPSVYHRRRKLFRMKGGSQIYLLIRVLGRGLRGGNLGNFLPIKVLLMQNAPMFVKL